MTKTYEEAINKMSEQLKSIRWIKSISADDCEGEYAELRGEVKMLAFLMGSEETDIYKDVIEAAGR